MLMSPTDGNCEVYSVGVSGSQCLGRVEACQKRHNVRRVHVAQPYLNRPWRLTSAISPVLNYMFT